MPARPLRRVVAVFTCSACLLLEPQAAWSLSARGRLDAGERGSGPRAWNGQNVARGNGRALATNGVRWSDVPNSLWAHKAIDFVGATNDWMLDSGPEADGRYAFKPDRSESRRLFARALSRAFGEGLPEGADLSFPDLPSDDRFFGFASTAVAAGWMRTDGDGSFRPTDPVTTREAHRAIVLAMGFGDLASGADALHLRNGTAIGTPRDFGTLLIGMRIGLRYNHRDESLDVGPDDELSRAEVAWSLFRAATRPAWLHDSLSGYATMTLPNITPKMQRVVSFALRYVGYPYVWGGDWNKPTSSRYCCGSQPVGGFDCSGLAWWIMKHAVPDWDPTPPRDYAGWDLPQRTSATMAAKGRRVRWDDKRPGDLLFYDGNDDGKVDHVDTFIGGDWAIDSGGSNAGVTITWISDNWYEDHFVRARRIIG